MTTLEDQLEALNTLTTEKSASDKPGDYLIVEDPEKKTTWHLQVKVDGKPDHNLMGAAMAALTVGHRGNVYAGPGKGEALAKLKKLYAAENMTMPGEKEAPEPSLLKQLVSWLTDWATKEGKRNSGADGERLQKAHDLLVENGAQCTLKVYKGTDGRLRWVTFSSTAFRDRDHEIVSTKALDEDVAQADATKEYGPLRWWHVDGLDLGQCDYNAMSGKVLIESGTFNSEQVGASIKEAADDLAVSIGFQHPPSEPDAAGVFHHIRRFERSLLPADKASNLFTQLSVAKEQDDMTLLKEKLDQLKKLIGDGPAEALAAKAELTEKEALAAGVTFKETPAPVAEVKDEDKPPDFGAMVEKCMKACDALGARMDAHEKSHKEAHDAEGEEAAKATKEVNDQVTLLAAAVAELMGETPRSAKGFRASQEGTARPETAATGPQPNTEFDKFINWSITGKQA